MNIPKNKVYSGSPAFMLPDGTLLSDICSNNEGTNRTSLGRGIIPAHSQSEIHVHPVVVQTTYVLSGSIQIKMKRLGESVETFVLPNGSAIITHPMVSYQIANVSDMESHLLYIVSPSFAFIATEDPEQSVVFNDAVILGRAWETVDTQLNSIDVALFARQRAEVLGGSLLGKSMKLEPIGIMSAMSEEIDAINDRMIDKEKILIGKAIFTKGTLCDTQVVTAVLNLGWGKVDASTNATILATTFSVKSIIFSGVAGAFDPQLNIGDIVICDSAIQHDFDASPIFPRGIIPSTQKMETVTNALFKQCAEHSADRFIKKFDSIIEEKYIKQFNLHPKWVTGKIATGDQFLSQTNQADAVRALANDIQAVDMESAAVLHVAERFNIPAIVIRVISDNANHTAHIDFTSFIENVAKIYSRELVTHLIKELKTHLPIMMGSNLAFGND